MAPSTISGLEIGCYYSLQSYGSIARRFGAFIIDSVVLLLFVGLVSIGAMLFPAAGEISSTAATMVLIVGAWLYFVELGRMAFGTVGLRVMKLRIVDLKGGIPSRSQMLSRLAGGPIYELLRIPLDCEKKTIGDRLAQVYIIERDAQPAGFGPIAHDFCTMLGTVHWYFKEVKKPAG